jgi:hypothetical protein
MKNFLTSLTICIIISFFMDVNPSYSQIGVHIRIGPPPPRQEVIVERPYPEAVWIGGFHEYDPVTNVYVWRPGRWDRPPHPRMRWIAPRYKHRRGEYIYVPGRWK